MTKAPTSRDSSRRAAILKTYRDATDIPLLILALCTIPLLAAEFSADPTGTASQAIEIAYAAVWLAFVFDYFFELFMEEDRLAYARREWLAPVVIVLSVPIPGNPLQWLRSLRVLRIFRSVRVGAVAARGGRAAVSFPHDKTKQLWLAMVSFTAITISSAVAVYAVEADRRDAEIGSLGDALWWSVNTLTTIGGSSETPQTVAGRWLALLPMIAGVGLIGVVAANLATRLFDRLGDEMPELVQSSEERLLTEISTQLATLHERLARIEERTGSGRGDQK